MRGYSATQVFTPDEQKLLMKINNNLALLDNKEWEGVRCHEIAHAVGRHFKLLVGDGHYGAVDHSWCITSELNILDCYAIGSLPQVQLRRVSTPGLMSPYREGGARKDIDEDKVEALISWFKKGL